MTEIWKDIKGYENLYKVSNLGNIISLKTNKILKPNKGSNGYLLVHLYNNGIRSKHLLIHRLVAEAFLPNPNNYPQVNHKDYDRTNNRVENLEWCSPIQNLEYSNVIYKASLRKERKIKCLETNEVFKSIKEACRKYKLHHSNIIACCNGRRKRCGGLTWLYQM
jgi:hypothetical protein